MENYKADANLMIGDMMVTMTMMMMMICFLWHVRNTQTVLGIARCLSLQAFNNKSVVLLRGRLLAPSSPVRPRWKKNKHFVRSRNTWNVPRGEMKRNSLKLTVSRNSMKDDS